MYGWILTFFAIGTILVLISLTYFLYYYNLTNGCQDYDNYWCWTDWQCAGESDPAKQYPAQTAYGCNGERVRNSDYCTNPPPNTPGCTCSYSAGDGDLPSGCTCLWDTSQFGTCGYELCSNVNPSGCNQ